LGREYGVVSPHLHSLKEENEEIKGDFEEVDEDMLFTRRFGDIVEASYVRSFVLLHRTLVGTTASVVRLYCLTGERSSPLRDDMVLFGVVQHPRLPRLRGGTISISVGAIINRPFVK